MYDVENDICQRIKIMIVESEKCINLIYATPCIFNRNMLLYQLSNKIAGIEYLCNKLYIKNTQTSNSPWELPQLNQKNSRDITQQELAKYNGKDGNPAYVAVNGVVYDVTNNAAWAAASHFGLTAGKNLTSEFASCHAGQPILSKLKIIGKLV